MPVQSPNVGIELARVHQIGSDVRGIPNLVMLAQSALPNKRPSHGRDLAALRNLSITSRLAEDPATGVSSSRIQCLRSTRKRSATSRRLDSTETLP